METPASKPLQTADNTRLTREGRVLLWARVLERLEEGEVLLTDRQFRIAMEEEYILLQGVAPSAAVCAYIREMVASVNAHCPETYLTHGLENGVKKAFEHGVEQLNWDLLRIQEKGTAAVYRFSKHGFIRGMLKLRHLSFKPENAVHCVRQVIDQVECQQPEIQAWREAEAVAPETDTPPVSCPEPALFKDEEIQEAIEQGAITRREVAEQLRRHERRRAELEVQQMAQFSHHLAVHKDRGEFSEEEAENAVLICRINEQIRKGEIRREKGEALLDLEIPPAARRVLVEKILKAVAVPVTYLRLFESLKRIRLEFDAGLGVLIRHKHLILMDHPDQDLTPLVNDLLDQPYLLDQVWDIMTGKDREVRIITIPLPPYKSVVKYELDSIRNLTVDQSFIEDLRRLDLMDMSDRLNSPERSVRVRAAADIRCFIYLLNRVVKPGRCNHKLCMIKISHTLETIRSQVTGIYRSSPYLEAGRQRAKIYVRRALSRIMRHVPAASHYDAHQRSEAFILDVESKLRPHKQEGVLMEQAAESLWGAGVDISGRGNGLNVRTWEGPTSKPADLTPLGGVAAPAKPAAGADESCRTVRVEMRIAGKTRRVLTKIIPDEEDPEHYVIATVDPATGQLVPKIQRGAKRVVEQNERGVWQIVY